MRDPHVHAIPPDLGVAEASEAYDALQAALAAARTPEAGGDLVLDLAGPNPGQIALQLLIAGRAEALRSGLGLTLGDHAEAALRPVRATPVHAAPEDAG